MAAAARSRMVRRRGARGAACAASVALHAAAVAALLLPWRAPVVPAGGGAQTIAVALVMGGAGDRAAPEQGQGATAAETAAADPAVPQAPAPDALAPVEATPIATGAPEAAETVAPPEPVTLIATPASAGLQPPEASAPPVAPEAAPTASPPEPVRPAIGTIARAPTPATDTLPRPEPMETTLAELLPPEPAAPPPAAEPVETAAAALPLPPPALPPPPPEARPRRAVQAANSSRPPLPAPPRRDAGASPTAAALGPPATSPATNPATSPAVKPGPAASAAGASAAAAAATAGAPPAGPVLVTAPRYRRPPAPPDYPAPAVELGLTGTVTVRALVSPAGETEEARVWRSSGHALLDAAALRAVRRWAFEPASVEGRRVPAWVEVPVHFRLH